jgi:hypothetical protein
VHVPWRETLSEWASCAGLGLIPLLCMFAIAYLTDNQQLRNALLSAESIYHELILFCIVTNAASIIIFVSKFNLLQVVAPSGRTVPTAFIYGSLLVALACAFVFVAVIVAKRPALIPLLSCMITTLVFSLWAERRIGKIARE